MASTSVPQLRNSVVQLGEPTHQVYIIDDDVEIRRSLHFLLSSHGFVSWSFACALDFLDNLPNLEPAPILIDVQMPTISGIELMVILLEREIHWPVIVITGYGDIPAAVQATKLGAMEVLEKPLTFEDLETSLHAAMEQLSGIKDTADIRNNSRQLLDSLSRREIEVIAVLADGLPNKAAAHCLSLSVRTVEMHRANALCKLKVKSVAEVIQLARNAGCILTARK